MKWSKKKIFTSLLVVAGFGGGVLFFPLQINGSYTCFYHRIFNTDCPVEQAMSAMHQAKSMRDDHSEFNDLLLDMYLNHYALLWWASLAALAIGIYRLNRSHRKS